MVDEYEELINCFNNNLDSWGSNNNISILKTDLPFRLGTDEVDFMCYHSENNNPGIFLNRIGVIRLFTALSKQCTFFKLCKEWSTLRSDVVNILNVRTDHANNTNIRRDYDRRRGSVHDINVRKNSYNEIYSRHKQYPYRRPQPNHGYLRMAQDSYDKQPSNNNHERHLPSSNRYGCYNCGEFNHRQSNCRYDHKIRCNVCNTLGHKSRLCTQYNH